MMNPEQPEQATSQNNDEDDLFANSNDFSSLLGSEKPSIQQDDFMSHIQQDSNQPQHNDLGNEQSEQPKQPEEQQNTQENTTVENRNKDQNSEGLTGQKKEESTYEEVNDLFGDSSDDFLSALGGSIEQTPPQNNASNAFAAKIASQNTYTQNPTSSSFAQQPPVDQYTRNGSQIQSNVFTPNQAQQSSTPQQSVQPPQQTSQMQYVSQNTPSQLPQKEYVENSSTQLFGSSNNEKEFSSFIQREPIRNTNATNNHHPFINNPQNNVNQMSNQFNQMNVSQSPPQPAERTTPQSFNANSTPLHQNYQNSNYNNFSGNNTIANVNNNVPFNNFQNPNNTQFSTSSGIQNQYNLNTINNQGDISKSFSPTHQNQNMAGSNESNDVPFFMKPSFGNNTPNENTYNSNTSMYNNTEIVRNNHILNNNNISPSSFENPGNINTAPNQQNTNVNYMNSNYGYGNQYGNNSTQNNGMNYMSNYNQNGMSNNTYGASRGHPFDENEFFNKGNQHLKPVVSFGFGGKIVVMFPKSNTNQQPMNNQYTQNFNQMNGSTVTVHNTNEVLQHTSYVQSLNTFVSPLDPKRTDPNKLLDYIKNKAMSLEENQIQEQLNSKSFSSKQMWTILWHLVNFVLTSKSNSISENNKKNIDKTILWNDIKSTLLKYKQTESEWANEDRNNSPLAELTEYQQISPSTMQANLKQIESCLTEGNLEEAAAFASENKMWGHAFMLSSMVDKQSLQKVLTKFAQDSFPVGSPLRSLYLTFADRGDLIFDLPKVATDKFGNSFVSNSQEQQQKQKRQIAKICDNWRENLCLLITNKTPSTSSIIGKLGDCLWNENEMYKSAHVCYLLSDIFCENSNSIATKVNLFSGDHKRNLRNFVSVESIQMTEIIQYCQQCLTEEYVLPSLQIHKLVYAYYLLDVGLIDKAQEYLVSIKKTVEKSSQKFRYPKAFIHQFKTLDENLQKASKDKPQNSSSFGSFFSRSSSSNQSTVPKSSSTTAQIQQDGNKTGFSSWILGKFDNGLNKLVNGDDEEDSSIQQSHQHNQPQTQQNQPLQQQQQWNNMNNAQNIPQTNIPNNNSSNSLNESSNYNNNSTNTGSEQQKDSNQESSLSGKKQEKDNSSGWFGSWFKPKKRQANFGKDNEFVYSKEFNLWHKKGEDPEKVYKERNAPPPPATTSSTQEYDLSKYANLTPSRNTDLASKYGSASFFATKPSSNTATTSNTQPSLFPYNPSITPFNPSPSILQKQSNGNTTNQAALPTSSSMPQMSPSFFTPSPSINQSEQNDSSELLQRFQPQPNSFVPQFQPQQQPQQQHSYSANNTPREDQQEQQPYHPYSANATPVTYQQNSNQQQQQPYGNNLQQQSQKPQHQHQRSLSFQ